jgi:23S rRNA (cytidine2498-2'-O)-methyltransferase
MLTKPFSTIYIAKPDYLKELCTELGDISGVVGNMVFSSSVKPDICFALDIWHDAKMISFNSISEAVKILRQAGKYWYLNPIENIRRSRLIEEQLIKLPAIERHFPIEPPIPEIGCFSLLDANTLVYSAKRWKKWPLGHTFFIEDKKNPPNRAYLKLWEALSLIACYPKAGETAMDLGASPGGWTYVMQALGTHVTAVDKAELEPAIAALPRVKFLQQSAFALEPSSLASKIDWLLCDVACYPERLYPLISKWIAADKAKQMIFTIKLQGETDLASLQPFQQIPGARTLHMFQNKHEATFFYPAPSGLSGG